MTDILAALVEFLEGPGEVIVMRQSDWERLKHLIPEDQRDPNMMILPIEVMEKGYT